MSTVFVLGGARCVWTDIEAAASLVQQPDTVVVVNDIGIVYPRADAWATYHPELMAHWRAQRAANQLEPATSYWTTSEYPACAAYPEFKVLPVAGGSSGLLGACVAIALGARHVILCGVPIDHGMAHWHDRDKGQAWAEGSSYREGWVDRKAALTGRVRSMSGFTRELLGAPDKAWLSGGR
jgi:hypothetical protein